MLRTSLVRFLHTNEAYSGTRRNSFGPAALKHYEAAKKAKNDAEANKELDAASEKLS